MTGSVLEACADQARHCERLGSPFTARLMRALAATLDRRTAVGRAALDWRGRADAGGDAVPLRLAGALHALARDGAHPGLAAAWPPGPGTDDANLRALLVRTFREDGDALLEGLRHPPQTNEPGRSAALYAALLHVAGAAALPVSLFELGASAGLNLRPERYAHRLGGRRLGEAGSGVALAPDWEGPDPEGPEPVIATSRGCDRAPVDVTDATARARLLAFVWPDQPERLARLAAALEIARADPPTVDAADAADWIEARLPPAGEPGTVRVLCHAIARQYFPADVEARVAARLLACGAAATREAPFAHVAFEQDGARGPALDATLWTGGPGDGRTVRLAHGQAHGASLRWYGAGR